MSLLMDALRKAEKNKNFPPVAAEPSLEAAPSPADLEQPLALTDADAVPAEVSEETRKPTGQAVEQTAARNILVARGRPTKPSGRRRQLWASGTGLLIVAAAGIWWQLQASAAHLPNAAAATTIPQLAPALPPAACEAAQSAATPHPIETEAAAQPPRREARTQAPALAAENETENPIRLSRSRQQANPVLERAYQALQADRTDDAQQAYEEVLRDDSKNSDALLGLATLAVRRGQAASAAALYRQALESDPKDAYAQAGLINLTGLESPERSENRLKTLLASQPDSAALNFALGNLHSRQARWNEAQQAYFRAYAAEPDNADYLVNLAVSLDHLHQEPLAARYYRLALNAPAVPGSTFDKSRVNRRLHELQPPDR